MWLRETVSFLWAASEYSWHQNKNLSSYCEYYRWITSKVVQKPWKWTFRCSLPKWGSFQIVIISVKTCDTNFLNASKGILIELIVTEMWIYQINIFVTPCTLNCVRCHVFSNFWALSPGRYPMSPLCWTKDHGLEAMNAACLNAFSKRAVLTYWTATVQSLPLSLFRPCHPAASVQKY